jgi:hypothetical protein
MTANFHTILCFGEMSLIGRGEVYMYDAVTWLAAEICHRGASGVMASTTNSVKKSTQSLCALLARSHLLSNSI